MRMSTAFPSNYLRAADLQGRNVTVTMDRVEMEDIGGDHKPVLYFQGKEKGMVLNKTNNNAISTVYGDESDDWSGRQVVLFPAMVDFQGRTVEAIRVRVAPIKREVRDNITTGPQPPQEPRGQPDDPIPF